MKDIKKVESIKMDNGIEVEQYLTYSQIQAIVEQVCKFDSWAEREQAIDLTIVHFATNISDEESQKIGHDAMIQSGVMYQIRNNIKNFDEIYKAIAYTESTGRALDRLAKEVLPLIEKVEKLASKK